MQSQTETLILNISPKFSWTETFYTQLTATGVILNSVNFIDSQPRNHALSSIVILKCSMIDDPQNILLTFSPNNDNYQKCDTEFKITTTEDVIFSLWTIDNNNDLVLWDPKNEVDGYLSLSFTFFE